MYKAFLLLLLAPVISFAQVKTAAVKAPVQPKSKGFVITGEIAGLPKGAAVKLVNANTSTELASAVVQEKKASVKKNGKLVTTTTTYFKLTGNSYRRVFPFKAINVIPVVGVYPGGLK